MLASLGTESEANEAPTSRAKGSNRAVCRYRLEGAMKTKATDGELAKVTRGGRSAQFGHPTR